MPTISVDKAALFKELGREYVLVFLLVALEASANCYR